MSIRSSAAWRAPHARRAAAADRELVFGEGRVLRQAAQRRGAARVSSRSAMLDPPGARAPISACAHRCQRPIDRIDFCARRDRHPCPALRPPPAAPLTPPPFSPAGRRGRMSPMVAKDTPTDEPRVGHRAARGQGRGRSPEAPDGVRLRAAAWRLRWSSGAARILLGPKHLAHQLTPARRRSCPTQHSRASSTSSPRCSGWAASSSRGWPADRSHRYGPRYRIEFFSAPRSKAAPHRVRGGGRSSGGRRSAAASAATRCGRSASACSSPFGAGLANAALGIYLLHTGRQAPRLAHPGRRSLTAPSSPISGRASRPRPSASAWMLLTRPAVARRVVVGGAASAPQPDLDRPRPQCATPRGACCSTRRDTSLLRGRSCTPSMLKPRAPVVVARSTSRARHPLRGGFTHADARTSSARRPWASRRRTSSATRSERRVIMLPARPRRRDNVLPHRPLPPASSAPAADRRRPPPDPPRAVHRPCPGSRWKYGGAARSAAGLANKHGMGIGSV